MSEHNISFEGETIILPLKEWGSISPTFLAPKQSSCCADNCLCF